MTFTYSTNQLEYYCNLMLYLKLILFSMNGPIDQLDMCVFLSVCVCVLLCVICICVCVCVCHQLVLR